MDSKLKSISITTKQTYNRALDFKASSPYEKSIVGELELDIKTPTIFGNIVNTHKFNIESLPKVLIDNLMIAYNNIGEYIENVSVITEPDFDETKDGRDSVIDKNKNPDFDIMEAIDPLGTKEKQDRVDEILKKENTREPIKFSELTEEQKFEMVNKIQEAKASRGQIKTT